MYLHEPNIAPTHIAMGKRGCSINILLAGQTGVGRSTLINMITGAANGSTRAARVSNDVRPCPIETTMHTAPLQVDGETLECSLWDTRGLDEAVDHPNVMDTAATWLRQQGFGLFSKRQPERDLRDICRKRVNSSDDEEQSRSGPIVVLMWCIHASKIDVPIHWQHFRKVYIEYCNRRVKPVIVITQMTPGFATEWEERCKEQLGALDLGIGLGNINDLLLTVRRFRDTSSPEYMEDSLALKRLIFRLSANATIVKAKMSRSNKRALHVAIVGNTGVGKSTLVNVLKGDEIAEVNNDVKPCTTRKKEYEVVDGNTTYHIWDTRGLNEASEKEVLPIRILKFARILPDADRELKRFLRGREPSVDLVLLCIDAKKTRSKCTGRSLTRFTLISVKRD
ncbi:hypothetical protein JVT61DRAFT_4398 [Boletus reticuloceps]|uniref:G domain-containing protein n=1 Tax=Boletus reticuloceps TaxID=495285 RepID=A0A8I2YKL1_9AGAM|nr:hypothetical protein JVT61DRAFT_4398 [Boletus reticuloceps]